MKPDVIVKMRNQTLSFEPQNKRASDWLHRRCLLTGDTVTGNTEFLVHPSRFKEMIGELGAAGFLVACSESGT